MPKGKTKRKRSYKRKVKKGKWNIPNRLPQLDIQGGIGGFASSTIVKLKYAEEFSLNAAAGVMAAQTFRANSVFDPNESLGGHQPMEFDAWAKIYNHYTVLASKIILHAVPNSNASIVPSYWGVVLADDPNVIAGYTGITDIFENPNTSNPRVCGLRYTPTPAAANRITRSMRSNKFFGTKNVEDGGTYGALVTANPGKEAYWNCYTSSVGGNEPGTQYFLAELEYTVLFDQRVQGLQN